MSSLLDPSYHFAIGCFFGGLFHARQAQEEGDEHGPPGDEDKVKVVTEPEIAS